MRIKRKVQGQTNSTNTYFNLQGTTRFKFDCSLSKSSNNQNSLTINKPINTFA